MGVVRLLETSLADRGSHELDASEGAPAATIVEHLPCAHGEGHACALCRAGHVRALRQVMIDRVALHATDAHARLTTEGKDVVGAGVEHSLWVIKGCYIVEVAPRPTTGRRQGLIEGDKLVVCADAVDSASVRLALANALLRVARASVAEETSSLSTKEEEGGKPVACMPPSHLGLQSPHTTEAREGDGTAQVLVGIGCVEHAEHSAAPRDAAKAGSVH